MSPQDWFGVGVRMLAFWPAMMSFQYLLFFVDTRMGFSDYSPDGSFWKYSPTSYPLYIFAYGAFAVLLLWAAPSIVNFAYPPEESKAAREAGDSDESNSSPH